MPSSRIPYFDNLKCLLIALVVIGHVLDMSVVPDHRMAKAAFVFIYSFHMPLFIFTTGLFIDKAKLTTEKAIRRICFFVILGYTAKVLLQVMPAIFGKPVTFSLLSDSNVPWFMFALAAFYTLTLLLKNIDARVVLACSVVLGLLVGYDSSIGDFLYMSRIVVFFPFFWLGVMLEPAKVEAAMGKRTLRIVGVLALAAFAYVCISHTSEAYSYRLLLTGRNSFEAVSQSLEGCSWINRLIAYLASLAAGLGILAIVPHSFIPALTNAGTRTLQIYLLHLPLVQLCRYTGVLDFFGTLPRPGWILVLVPALCITALLSAPFFKKPLDALGALVLKPKAH